MDKMYDYESYDEGSIPSRSIASGLGNLTSFIRKLHDEFDSHTCNIFQSVCICTLFIFLYFIWDF